MPYEILRKDYGYLRPRLARSIQQIISGRLIDPYSLKRLDEYLQTLPQTKDLHAHTNYRELGYNPNHSCYKKYRQQLHDRILAEYLSNNTCISRGKPIAIFTGGLPGSGKSSFIKKHANWLNQTGIFKLDADEVRAKLPEYQGWNAAQTHEETSDIVNRLLDIAGSIHCRFDILFDGTMVNAKKYNQLADKLLAAGYDIYLIYITIPLEDSINRALQRYQRSGRYVPLAIIKDTARKGTAVFEELKRKATGWVQFDSIAQTITASGGNDIPSDRNYSSLGSIIAKINGAAGIGAVKRNTFNYKYWW